jgi:hypothetical protein
MIWIGREHAWEVVMRSAKIGGGDRSKAVAVNSEWPREPEPGTVAWIVAKRAPLRRALREEKFNKELAQVLFQKIEQSGDWKLLSDMNGRPFRTFDAFCESSNGLDMPRREIERRLTAAQKMAADPDLRPVLPEVHAGPGRGHKTATM